VKKLVFLLVLVAASLGLIELEIVQVDNKVTEEPDVYSVGDVVDGDTIDVYNSTDNVTVRLIGVDTPEVHVEVDPGQYEGIGDTEASRSCLREAGENASRLMRELAGERVELQYDSMTDRRGFYDRLLAYVHPTNSENSINYRLLESGLASVYPNEFEEKERFVEAENQARNNNLGLWQCKNVSG
jgi:micrococcal nuclease